MAVLALRVAPNPVLRRKARRVQAIDGSIRKLADDLIDTMRHHQGIGLAANQVGVLKRVIVLEVPEEPLHILVNPAIIKRAGEREVEEGCLSVPGYRGLIIRSVWVRAKALELEGKEVRIKAEGLLAQALEHEIDHLNGILYLDHLKKHEDLWKLEPEEEAAQEGAQDEALLHHPSLQAREPHGAPRA